MVSYGITTDSRIFTKMAHLPYLPGYVQSLYYLDVTRVEGDMWCISKRFGLDGRIDLDTVDALSGEFAAISKTDERESDGVS